MRPKFRNKPQQELELSPNMDPLCQQIFGMTEREFFKMFETPSSPDDDETTERY